MQIQPGCKITFTCALKSNEGELLESDNHTLLFAPGQGDLPAAIEDALLGQSAGGKHRRSSPPAD